MRLLIEELLAPGRLCRKSSGREGTLSMRRRDVEDGDSLPVMVPGSDKALVAISPERMRGRTCYDHV